MKTTVITLAQAAANIEENGQSIKVGSFDTFGEFASYFDIHYRPMLERIENGEDISENDRHLLNFLAADLLAAFKTEDSDESEDEEQPDRLLVVFRDESQYRRARDFYCLKASEAPTAFYAEDYSDEIRALYFNENPDTLGALERDLAEDLEYYGFTGYHFEQD